MADFGAKPDNAAVVKEVVDKLGGLHILVNNAGTIRRNNSIDFTEADWDAVIDVNLKSVFFLSQAAARHMIPNGGGKIINIASMLSFQGGIRVPSYTASKSGIAGLTKILANEWAVSGINVNAIAPGYFATNNTVALQADVKRNAEILARIPCGPLGRPQGSRRRRGVPRVERGQLRARRHPSCRRRVAGALDAVSSEACASHSSVSARWARAWPGGSSPLATPCRCTTARPSAPRPSARWARASRVAASRRRTRRRHHRHDRGRRIIARRCGWATSARWPPTTCPTRLAIECSTLSHDWVLELAGQVRERGFRYVDAPVTGLPDAAAAGTLTLLVGADAGGPRCRAADIRVTGGTASCTSAPWARALSTNSW